MPLVVIAGDPLTARRAIAGARRVLPRPAAIVSAIIGLAACATYQPAPLQPEQSAARFVERRLDSAEVRDGVAALLPQAQKTWPPQPWNRAELLAVALVLNPKLAVARAQVDAALAHEIGAGQRPNPQLTLQSEYARHDPHPWLYGVALDLLLVSGERRQLDVDLARLETSSARWQLMDQAWEVRRALLAALSDREGVRRRLALLEELGAAQQQLVGHEQRRVASGEDAAELLAAALQARIEIEQLQAQARSDLAAAEAAAAAALGVTIAAFDGVAIDWPDWGAPAAAPDSALRQAREQALRSRSDLAAAIAAYAEAEDRLHAAVLRQYPQIHLEPGYYWDHGIAKFPLNAAFDLPLFNRNEGEIAETTAARDVASRRMLGVQAGIIGAIDAAQRAEHIAAASADVAHRGFQSARAQRRNAAANLRLGDIGAVEDLAAEIVALRSELELLHMQEQLQAARNALEDALHAPLSGPELELAEPLPVAVTGAAR